MDVKTLISREEGEHGHDGIVADIADMFERDRHSHRAQSNGGVRGWIDRLFDQTTPE
ncbi:hypothetical protein [Pseudonocardia sp. TMWB2A]|uniref:hypothetical protein n=1 Tax=Pseudonocardia sp. TMWB2A TaxID=687430 RepID=UPI00307D8FC1